MDGGGIDGMMKYECKYIKDEIAIDGDIEKPIWQQADVLDFYIPVTGEKAKSKTEGRLLWSDHYLYVGFKAYDKDLFGYHTAHDATTCEDDVLEIFFKTNPAMEPYHNFEINVLNAVYDAYNLRRKTAGSHRRWSKWNCAGLKSAVTMKGTLNDYHDQDEWWQLEVAIPFRSLHIQRGSSPQPGDSWLFHLSRYDYSIYLEDGCELSSTAKLQEVDFHRYEDWDRLVFVK
jgi:hypothetical protein